MGHEDLKNGELKKQCYCGLLCNYGKMKEKLDREWEYIMKIRFNLKGLLSIVFYVFIIFYCFSPDEIVKAEYTDDYDEDDFYEDDDDFYDDLVYVICDESEITLEVGQSKKIKVEVDDDYDTDNELIWESADDSIASVDENGKVTGNSPGKTTITVYYGNNSDKCTVKVKKKTPSYHDVSKKLKKISKSSKKFTYKTVDVGNKCRLYINTDISDLDKSTWSSRGYASAVSFISYIEVSKKGKGSSTRLIIFGGLTQACYYSIDLTASQLKLSTSNRKLSLDLKETDSSSYLSNGVFYANSYAKAVVASSSDNNTKILKKYNKMLGQKSLTLKFLCEDGAYHRVKVTKKDRESLKKLNKAYSEIMKLY